MNENNDEVNELDILNEGRKTIEVIFKDGSKGEVTVKKVGLVNMPKLHAAIDPLTQAACYVEGASAERLENLSEESLMDVLEAGQEINDPLFLRWLKQLERKLRMQGLDVEELRTTVAEKVVKELKDQSSRSAESSRASSGTDMTRNA